MKTPNNIEVNGNVAVTPIVNSNGNRKSRLLPAGIGIASAPSVPAVKRSQPSVLKMAPTIADIVRVAIPPAVIAAAVNDTEPDCTDTEEYDLKERFQCVLIAHNRQESSLSEVVVDMIIAEITRETAIAWGIEAGLSESYVQSTVSRLYIELTGERVKKVGGGRKANKGAAGFAERALKACDDDVDKAKALLLAARRLIETWEKAGTVASELAKLRAKSA